MLPEHTQRGYVKEMKFMELYTKQKNRIQEIQRIYLRETCMNVPNNLSLQKMILHNSVQNLTEP
jgi:hypothetical protein